MGILTVERTRELFFKDKIKNQKKGSQEGFQIAIDNFEKFSMEKFGKVNIIPDMIEANDNEVFDTLQSWINWNSDRAPSTTIIYFSRLRKYLHYMGLKLDSQDIKNELEFKHSVHEELYGLELDDIQKILKQFNYHTKVQFMCQLSGLMRVGEIVQLRKKHLILSNENIIVKIPPTIAKFNKGRTTFFSKEASRLLRPKLRTLEDDDLVFASNENSRYAEINAEQKLRRCIIKVGLDMRYETTDRYYINTHSFRAYGITKLSRYDPNFAKKIAGQKGYLDQYDRLSDDDKLELYQKYEIDLTIDNTAKLKEENRKLESEKLEHNSLKELIRNLEAKVEKQELKNAEIYQIQYQIKETMARESDPANPDFPDGSPYDTRLINLMVEKIDENSIHIFDSAFEEQIHVILRKNKVYCTLDNSITCKHILFALGNSEFYEIAKNHNVEIPFPTS